MQRQSPPLQSSTATGTAESSSEPYCLAGMRGPSQRGGHTVGLKADGTVVGGGTGYGDVESWSDIVAIAAGDNYTVGLKADGTVVATEYLGYYKYYDGQCDVDGWTDIKLPA